MVTALFDINGDGEDRGFEATPSELLTLRLRPPVGVGVGTVVFQVYNPSAFDPGQGIEVNPPSASKGAPLLTLVGATSGQSVSPSTPGGNVTVTMPASSGHSWIVRCIVNGGYRSLPGGGVVLDPTFIHQRGVFISTGFGTRKIIGTERNEFSVGGWPDAINDLVDLGGSVPQTFLPSGLGAVSRSISGYLNQGIHVFSFMSDAVRADAIACTMAFDHQPAIQAAIDYALYKNTAGGNAAGPGVQLGGAVLRSDRPINVGYGVDFRGLIVEGEGIRFGGTHGAQGSGTMIVFAHSDAPGFVVQGGRNVVLRNFGIEGTNYAHCVERVVTPDMTGLDMSAWIAPGLSNGRYNPYVGIAIDPYSGPQPGSHYPDVPYPAWLGAVAQYGKEASSNTLIENVSIVGFVGAIGQQTCDYDGNGDYTKLERVDIRYCAWGVSWGNSQSRIMRWQGCVFYGMHTCFTTRLHGRLQGKPALSISDTEFSGSIYVFDLPTLSFGEGPIFLGCFGEAMYALGTTNGGLTACGMTFKSCEFGFTLWDTYGVPATILEHNMASLIRFENTNFYNPIGFGSFHFQSYGADGDLEAARVYEFSGCSVSMFDALSMSGERWAQCAMSGTLGITIAGASLVLERFSIGCGFTYDLDTGAQVQSKLFRECDTGPRNRGLKVYTKFAKSLLYGNDSGVPVGRRFATVTASGGIVSQVGRTVEIIATGTSTAQLMVSGGDVGDVVICERTRAVFWVKKRIGDHITMFAQTGFNKLGNLLIPLVSGDSFNTVNCRHYMPVGHILYGDMTSGSPTITNVVEGGGGWTVPVSSHFAVGDFIFCDADVDRFIDPVGAAITSIDDVAHSITFASNFLFTRTRVRLGPFVRLAMPNAA